MNKTNLSLILAGLLGFAFAVGNTGCAAIASKQAMAKRIEKLEREKAELEAQIEEEGEEEEESSPPAKTEKAETPTEKSEKPSAKLKELEEENKVLAEQLERSEGEKRKLREAIMKTPAPAKKIAKVETPVAAAPPAPMPMPGVDPRLFLGGTVGPAAGYVSLDPMDNRPCGGMCQAERNKSHFYMAVYVDEREMTIHSGLRATLAAANVAIPGGGGRPGIISVARPGQLVKWMHGSVGNHTVRMVFYTMLPGNILQPVGFAQRTHEFPRLEGGAWGLLEEVSGPDQRIAMYQ